MIMAIQYYLILKFETELLNNNLNNLICKTIEPIVHY
jgi:hypothetical protein